MKAALHSSLVQRLFLLLTLIDGSARHQRQSAILRW